MFLNYTSLGSEGKVPGDIRLPTGVVILDDPRNKPAAIQWPLAIDYRLDQLLGVVRQAGRRNASRKDLAAAIVLGAPEDPTELLRLFDEYMVATNGRAHVGPLPESNVISIKRQKPGPRPGSAAG